MGYASKEYTLFLNNEAKEQLMLLSDTLENVLWDETEPDDADDALTAEENKRQVRTWIMILNHLVMGKVIEEDECYPELHRQNKA